MFLFISYYFFNIYNDIIIIIIINKQMPGLKSHLLRIYESLIDMINISLFFDKENIEENDNK